MKRRFLRHAAGFTMLELIIAAAIAALVMAAVFSGAMTMQRCFAAAEDFAIAKTDQARLTDYIALDLRRALTVTEGDKVNTIVTMTIPDYYDADGKPRTPTISKYVASYGDPTKPRTITYHKSGAKIVRRENGGPPHEVAVNVEDFDADVVDLGKVAKTKVSFMPRFQRKETAAAREATTVYGTTLLRNQRKD